LAEERSTIRVTAEYEAFPLWIELPDGVSNVDPSDPQLGLPQPLAAALIAWSDDYDRTYDPADPLAGGLKSRATAFNARGRHLSQEIAEALGPRYDVTYVEAS
jgi:hypothetical protein